MEWSAVASLMGKPTVSRAAPTRAHCCLLQGLPDEKGRIQILNIHTARMRDNKLLAGDVDVNELAVETKNYSGAELEGLVRAAQSTAMNRHIKVTFTAHT